MTSLGYVPWPDIIESNQLHMYLISFISTWFSDILVLSDDTDTVCVYSLLAVAGRHHLVRFRLDAD